MFFLKTWFLGIKKEIKRIRWTNIDDVWVKTFKVILFCLVFFVFFITIDTIIAILINWLETKPKAFV